MKSSPFEGSLPLARNASIRKEQNRQNHNEHSQTMPIPCSSLVKFVTTKGTFNKKTNHPNPNQFDYSKYLETNKSMRNYMLILNEIKNWK
jgi:hypothetical protein